MAAAYPWMTFSAVAFRAFVARILEAVIVPADCTAATDDRAESRKQKCPSHVSELDSCYTSGCAPLGDQCGERKRPNEEYVRGIEGIQRAGLPGKSFGRHDRVKVDEMSGVIAATTAKIRQTRRRQFHHPARSICRRSLSARMSSCFTGGHASGSQVRVRIVWMRSSRRT